jgi:putative ABC transport system substrate-binding protein
MLSIFRKIKQTLFITLVLSYPSLSLSATVGISQIVDHPALNLTHQGIVDTLAARKDIIITTDNAQGNAAAAVQIAQKFVGQQVDIIITIGTPSSQAAQNAVRGTTIPVFFASVTDPKAANLLKNPQNPEGQITGSSNFTDIKQQLELFVSLNPNLKRLGMIYNPAEANSVILVEKTLEAAQVLDIAVEAITASTTRDVAAAARTLVGKVEAIYITNDNTALSAFEGIVKVATESRIPVYVSDVDLVEKGAIAALGPNQYNVGVACAQLILKYLEGEAIKYLSVAYPTNAELYLNKTQAAKIGLTLPEKIIEQAVKTF